MSKQDEQFLPALVDEQIEALSSAQPEDTSSSARLISNLRLAYEEDAEIVAQVWTRLAERTTEKKCIMAGQESARSSSLRAGQEDPQKGPRQMKLFKTKRQGRLGLLQPLVAVLVLIVEFSVVSLVEWSVRSYITENNLH